MLPKFLYVVLVLLLTILHICSHLNPIIKANAIIKTINFDYTRELKLHVGYRYHSGFLWQALVNSLIVIYGLWRCQRAVDQQKQRQLDALNPPVNQNRNLNQTNGPLTGNPYISPATEVKLNWLRSRSKIPSSWQLFPLRVFALYSMPWLLTFLLNGFFGYTAVNLVMRNFCTSQPEVLKLCFRIQRLYLQNWLPHGISHYVAKFHGAFEFLFATHTNFIAYPTDVLLEGD
ncbi:uncharacterized protein LOC133840382 [Drosophila sulfurigaster albostrigata]|nr:uncharacterized protein LOC132789000 [Drosophila nasuta]XP_062128173.1 uncharacterized protein LOC133840382 [Drosophila sulfurigaster albostrigata]